MIFKEKINPYKRPLGEIYRAIFKEMKGRLAWDLNPESKRSLNKFRALKDAHKGEKAVMLFNGPSLLKTDFSLLKNTFTFGLNKINLLSELTGFTPSVLVAFDELLNAQNKEFFLNSPNLLKLLNYRTYGDLKVTGKDLIYLYCVGDPSFCYDPSLALASRSSTPYIAFQIAYYMGFEQIAIVGADHNFPAHQALAKSINEKEDVMHFHKDYHKKGDVNHQFPDRYLLDMIFRDVRLAYEMKNRVVYNATEGGNLEVFERKSLKDFLA